MINLEQIKDYCQGKSVCLVGNGRQTTEGFNGEYIDSHDIVIRINGGVPKPELKEHMGSKFNLWVYSSCPQKIGRFVELDKIYNPDYILRLRCKIAYPHKTMIHKTFFQCGDRNGVPSQTDKDYLEIHDLLKKEPTTGCQAFHFIKRNIPYSKLSLVGFDFFEKDNPALGSVFYDKRYDHNAEKRFILANVDENLCTYDNNVIITA